MARQLYNGNIAAMVVAIPKFNQINFTVPIANIYGYKYDQLNRIISMDVFTGIDNNTNVFVPSASLNYKERITYDPNGNIRTYQRNGSILTGGLQTMDDLTYQYEKDAAGNILSNKLRYVHDQVADANYTEDINNQTTLTLTQVQNERSAAISSDNYQYDAIGNLIKDTKEDINNIIWNVYGKIQSITKTTGTISYTYDASGNRISKLANGIETWYVRDASGNVMSVYTKDATINTGDLTQTEIHLYGSSRLGVLNTTTNVQNVVANTTGIYTFTRGNKFFELSNHLGNVLVTISDKKIVYVVTNDGIAEYYKADVITASDYYPFGMQLPGRSFSNGGKYRYGFNGKEKSDEIAFGHLDFGARVYDSRIGRWLSIDPLQKKYPSFSPYNFSANNPVIFVDRDGKDFIIFVRTNINQSINTIYDQFTGGTYTNLGSNSFSEMQYVVIKAPGEDRFFYQINERKEEITNHYNSSFGGVDSKLLSTGTRVVDSKMGETNEFFPIWNSHNPYPPEQQVGDMNLRYNTLSITSTGYDMFFFDIKLAEGDYIQLAKLSTPTLKKNLIARNPALYSFLETISSDYAIGMTGLEVYSIAAPALEMFSPSILKEVKATIQNFKGPGGMARLKFEGASYHGKIGTSSKSPGPIDGQGALDASLQVKETSARRVGIDYANKQFVVFDETGKGSGVYHGHVRPWNELHQDMKNILIKSEMADAKGNILTGN